MSIIDTYAENPNKLTTENAESEERSVYKSATDGPIPLSFKGRHLMQRLRTSTMAAIQFGNWHVFGEALSRSRAAIAKRMGELEARVSSADSFGAWANNIRTKNLIKRCVRAEGKHQELAFDYQLLIQDRDNYAAGYATQIEKVSKLEQQLKDADTHIDALQSVKDAFKRIAARRYARLAELEQQIKANEGIIELQAQRLATTRVQFDSIAEAARACADAAGLDP